jgi:hypothetical protein
MFWFRAFFRPATNNFAASSAGWDSSEAYLSEEEAISAACHYRDLDRNIERVDILEASSRREERDPVCVAQVWAEEAE